MKRLLVVTLFVVGLAAVAGSMAVNRHRMVADGDPFPPPYPPKPPACETKLSPQLIADGDPFPPPFPHQWGNRLPEAV